MSWNGQDNISASIIERGFTIDVDERVVPGVYWRPVGADADRLVLLGHGGTAHKKTEYIEQVAHGLCGLGIAAMAIDGPGHGDRPSAVDFSAGSASADPAEFARRWNSDGGTQSVVADWKAALDFLEASEGGRTTGWWGLSMGTMMGLPVCVAEERVKVAVLGLMGGWGPNADDLVRTAPELAIPVRFLVQWHDEIVPRDKCLDLYDALGTAKKSMHVNPGAHSAVPTFEVIASIEYLAHHLAKIG